MMTTFYKFDLVGYYAGSTLVNEARSTTVAPPNDPNFKYNWNDVAWVAFPLDHPVPVFAGAGHVQSMLDTDALIDVGPFLDRFGNYKMALLASANPVVQAIIKDVTTRKWIDLSRDDVLQGINYLLSQSLITEEIKTAALATPVTDSENIALRKLYFS